jgi:hypothetical protein
MPNVWEDIFRRVVTEVVKELANRNQQPPNPSPPPRPPRPPGRRDRGVVIVRLRDNDLRPRSSQYARLNILLASHTVEEAQRRDPRIDQGFIHWAIAQGYIGLAPGPARSGGRRR